MYELIQSALKFMDHLLTYVYYPISCRDRKDNYYKKDKGEDVLEWTLPTLNVKTVEQQCVVFYIIMAEIPFSLFSFLLENILNCGMKQWSFTSGPVQDISAAQQ